MSFHCPHCGEPLRARDRFCRECGSDRDTGWSEEADGGFVDVPDEMGEDDYQEFLAREFPRQATARARWKVRAPVIILGILVVALLLWILR